MASYENVNGVLVPINNEFDPELLNESTSTPTDNDVIITKESSTWYKKAFSKIWDYIKAKLGINASGATNKVLNEKGQFAVPPEALRVYRDDAVKMLFQWSGNAGQPSWLWGSNDGTNISVWNPLYFRVAQADALTNLAFKTIIAGTYTKTWSAGQEIIAGQVGYVSGKFLVFFNVQWFQGNVWFHLVDCATGGGICDCVGGSNASGMAVGWLEMPSDRWLRITCDGAFTNATVVFKVSLLRLSA